jgi:hypothetical protein
MRACFQGQNVIALGNGIARLQTPPLVIDTPQQPKSGEAEKSDTAPTAPQLGLMTSKNEQARRSL